MKNIQIISDAYLCCNCGACSAICPKDAISYETNSIGRMYAKVNAQCIDCGLCQKVCPSIDHYQLHEKYQDRYVGLIKSTYIGRSTDKSVYINAQSGGVATATISYLFKSQKIDAAILCRMDFGNTPDVQAVVVTDVQQLKDCQKSCYTPVALLSVLNQIEEKSSVAIVGLPCHLEGLLSLQQQTKKYDIIKYKIGLVCDRTLCGSLQDVIQSYVPFSPIKIHWRDKFSTIPNYRSAPIVGEGQNGEKVELPRRYRTGLKDMFTSPRCRLCSNKLNVHADVVLGDPWGMKDVDWQNGDSLIMTRTTLGEELIQEMQSAGCICIKKASVRDAVKGQHINARRKQVTAAAVAYRNVFANDESFLAKQHDSDYVLNEEIGKQQDLVQSFVKREAYTKQAIVDEARQYLASEKPSKNSIVSRIYHKIIPAKEAPSFKVLLSGLETHNKGAELMLYAVLQELERSHPDAIVYIDRNMVKQGLGYLQSPIDIRFTPVTRIQRFGSKLHVTGVLNRMKIYSKALNGVSSIHGLTYYLDGSGLRFSDQRKISKYFADFLNFWLKSFAKKGIKSVYLPQAFGPLEKKNTQSAIAALDKYADRIFAREKKSYDYLDTIVKNKEKVKISTDFTSLVDGNFPVQYEHLRNAVCIIPNQRMIDRGVISEEDYIDLFVRISKCSSEKGYHTYLLNHEGKLDERLCNLCKSYLGEDVEVVSGLNALETKGLISSAHLVVSSRFHGVVSSLNSAVPCISTSWNHKYSELYKDYGIQSYVLPLGNIDECMKMIDDVLHPDVHSAICEQLVSISPQIRQQAIDMWKDIWSLKN